MKHQQAKQTVGEKQWAVRGGRWEGPKIRATNPKRVAFLILHLLSRQQVPFVEVLIDTMKVLPIQITYICSAKSAVMPVMSVCDGRG